MSIGLFQNNTNIKSVIIPDTVESIGVNCFSGCTSLSTVVLSANIKSVHDSAFYKCTSLTAIDLPDGLETIGEKSFSGCKNLADVTIPASINKVGVNAFANTPFLKDIDDDMVIFGSALYAYNGNESSVTIPDGITSITGEAFIFHMNLENVILPDTLVSIGKNAFTGCQTMSYVVMPESVAEIEDYAIGYECENGYSGTYVHTGLTFCGKKGSVAETYAVKNEFDFVPLDIEDNSCGDNLTYSIDFSKGVLTISGTGAMADYDSTDYINETTSVAPYYNFRLLIKSIVIEEGVTSIGENAFYNFYNITSVSLPSTLTKIKKNAFKYVSSLEEIVLPDGLENIGVSAFAYMGSLKKINIPDTVTLIDIDAFHECSSLVSINFPASLTSSRIDYSVFNGCSSLEYVELDSENTEFCEENGVIYDIYKSRIIVYPENSPLEEYSVPPTVRTIEPSVFNSPNLRCLIIPEGVDISPHVSLKNCISLERIVFLDDNPPKSFIRDLSSNIKRPITIICSFSAENWKEIMEQYNGGNIIWEDKDQLDSYSTLTIENVPETVNVGDTFILKAKLDLQLGAVFNWSSDNENVAVVERNGNVTILNEGEATILCKTPDGKYSTSVTINVASSSLDSLKPYEYMEIDKDIVGTPFKSMQFPCEKLGGIYFLNASIYGGTLSFYSLRTKKVEWETSFSYVKDFYENNGLLYILYSNNCQILDLETRQIKRKFSVPAGFTAGAVGADDQGRVYIYAQKKEYTFDSRIFLMNDSGEVYSYTSAPNYVYSFNGFNNETGKFYMETRYNFRSYGYDHLGRALNMGVVVDNQIQCIKNSYTIIDQGVIPREFDCLQYLCQDLSFKHQNGAELLGNRYLVSVSPMTSTYTVKDPDSLDILMELARENIIAGNQIDISSVGTCSVYNPVHDSIIMCDNDMNIIEYLPETQTVLSIYKAKNSVYSLKKMGDYIIAIENAQGGGYTMEMIEWKAPEKIELICDSIEMYVSESQELSVVNNSIVDSKFKWSSSDTSIVSVSENGVLTAWSKGEAVISCDTFNGKVHAEIKVTVLPKDVPAGKTVTCSDAAVTNNISDNNYKIYNDIACSFLTETDDGNLIRVEGTKDNIITEIYKPDGSLLKSSVIEKELPLFGGFYSTSDAYYILTGQNNPNESNSVEVLRLTKYSKEWERLDSCSVYGANSYSVFNGGNASFAEADGKLYIHTCHEMYSDSEGTNHQANMTVVINTEKMTLIESMTGVSVPSYVAHSLSQYIKEDDNYIYRLDHGDGVPRAVSLSRISKNGSLNAVTNTYYDLYSIRGMVGDNQTGVSVGGMELSNNNILVAINSIDMKAKDYLPNGNRNIILIVASKYGSRKNQINLTNYMESDVITVYTPQIVKLSSDAFMIMWEEKSDAGIVTKIAACNGDGVVNLKDTVLIRRYIAGGWDVTIDEDIADVNNDGAVTMKDVVLISRCCADGWDVDLK